MSHLTPEQWQRYRTGRLQAGELAQIDAHLAQCPECRAKLLSDAQRHQAVKRLQVQLFSRRPSECLSHDQIADYLHGRLGRDERQRVEGHLQTCPLCAQDMRALKEWQQTLPPHLPVPPPSRPITWKQRLANLLTNRWLIAWEGVALIALIFFVSLHLHQQALMTQWQQVNHQLTHLHGHFQKLQEQVQSLQQGQQQWSDIRKQLAQVQRQLQGLQKRLTTTQPTPLLTLRDTAGWVTVTWDGQWRLPFSLPPEWQNRLRRMLTEGKLERPKPVRLAWAAMGEAVTMRGKGGVSEKVKLLSPVMTAVRSLRPTFRWMAVDGAAGYKLLLADRSATHILWESPLTQETTFRLPSDAPALKRGEIYTWQVEARRQNDALLSPPARFWVLDDASAAQVARMERRFAHSALTLLTLYASFGLKDEAMAQWQRLQRLNPHHPALQWLPRTFTPANGSN
jgi:predicted anti-sigma-YlaC factor YlaD